MSDEELWKGCRNGFTNSCGKQPWPQETQESAIVGTNTVDVRDLHLKIVSDTAIQTFWIHEVEYGERQALEVGILGGV